MADSKRSDSGSRATFHVNSNSNSKPKKSILIPPPVLTSTYIQTSDIKNYEDQINMLENQEKKIAKKKKSKRFCSTFKRFGA